MSPQEREALNIEAFLRPDEEIIGGIKLRPLSAGSFALLRTVKNELLFPTLKELYKDEVTGEELTRLVPANPELAALEFVYIQGAPLAEVRRTVWSEQLFREKVLEFAETISVKDLGTITAEIQRIIVESLPAMVAVVPKKSSEAVDPDAEEPPPN